MDSEKNLHDPNELPFNVSDDLGTIIESEWQCPGVWYVANEGNGRFAGEFYIVESNTPCISDAAKLAGAYLENHPDLLLYSLDDPEGGRGIIRYEIARYRKLHDLPMPDSESLLTAAVYAMENNPEYFGNYPAPIQTPHGTLTRYKAIINGVFALETDECQRLIAVCYPLWQAAFSGYTKLLGEQTEHDQQFGIDNTLGYLFFTEDNGCLALFELLGEFPQILKSKLIDAPALNNAIWKHHPDYAVLFNRDEQEGLHDALGMLQRFLYGEDVELSVSIEHMITFNLNAGTNYLHF